MQDRRKVFPHTLPLLLHNVCGWRLANINYQIARLITLQQHQWWSQTGKHQAIINHINTHAQKGNGRAVPHPPKGRICTNILFWNSHLCQLLKYYTLEPVSNYKCFVNHSSPVTNPRTKHAETIKFFNWPHICRRPPTADPVQSAQTHQPTNSSKPRIPHTSESINSVFQIIMCWREHVLPNSWVLLDQVYATITPPPPKNKIKNSNTRCGGGGGGGGGAEGWRKSEVSISGIVSVISTCWKWKNAT